MGPRDRRRTPQDDLFRNELANLLDQRHPLVKHRIQGATTNHTQLARQVVQTPLFKIMQNRSLCHIRRVSRSGLGRIVPSSRMSGIRRTVESPMYEEVQTDGRIRRWTNIQEMEGRYLRVVLLFDRETVQNAFFDRRLNP